MHNTLSEAANALERIRQSRPRVHAVTSTVAAELTANTLLALGARPTLTDHPDEVEDFVEAAKGLIVNLGMMDGDRREGARLASAKAALTGTPWALDPVHCESSPRRIEFAKLLLLHDPAVLRVNALEEAVLGPAPGIVTLTSGATDVVRDGERVFHVSGGHPWLDAVTAVGCAQGALIAAFLSVGATSAAAALGASVCMKRAGEAAAANARGPGTFAPALLDALHALTAHDVETARLTEKARP